MGDSDVKLGLMKCTEKDTSVSDIYSIKTKEFYFVHPAICKSVQRRRLFWFKQKICTVEHGESEGNYRLTNTDQLGV